MTFVNVLNKMVPILNIIYSDEVSVVDIIIPFINIAFLIFIVYFMILVTKALKIYIRNNKNK